MRPCGSHRRDEILDQPVDRREGIGPLTPAPMLLLAFAALVVEADNTLAAHNIGRTILIVVGGRRNRSRQAPHHQFDHVTFGGHVLEARDQRRPHRWHLCQRCGLLSNPPTVTLSWLPLLALPITEAMRKRNLAPKRLAERMKTSRIQLSRLRA